MREHLVGYLLGALDSPESEVLESHLAKDRQLQEELELLRSGLEPLEADSDPIDPPPGLAARTVRFVSQRVEEEVVSPAPAAPRRAAALIGGRETAPSANRWTLWDVAVAASVIIAMIMLFLPAVNSSRHNAQLAACTNNLKQLGHSLITYSRQHDGYFPQIPLKGKLAAAGTYAPLLFDSGYLDDPRSVICPATALADDRTFAVPSRKQIEAADPQRLIELRRVMGGSYGYTLGHVNNGVYEPTRNRSRERFALMSDAPTLHLAHFQSANHGGCGQNVLLEDGHVKYLTNCQLSEFGDDIFCNDSGKLAPGMHPDDSVIGHSAVAPEITPASN